jgi:hypothetical protein
LQLGDLAQVTTYKCRGVSGSPAPKLPRPARVMISARSHCLSILLIGCARSCGKVRERWGPRQASTVLPLAAARAPASKAGVRASKLGTRHCTHMIDGAEFALSSSVVNRCKAHKHPAAACTPRVLRECCMHMHGTN